MHAVVGPSPHASLPTVARGQTAKLKLRTAHTGTQRAYGPRAGGRTASPAASLPFVRLQQRFKCLVPSQITPTAAGNAGSEGGL